MPRRKQEITKDHLSVTIDPTLSQAIERYKADEKNHVLFEYKSFIHAGKKKTVPPTNSLITSLALTAFLKDYIKPSDK